VNLSSIAVTQEYVIICDSLFQAAFDDFILLSGGTMEVEVDNRLEIEIIGHPESIFMKSTGTIYTEWGGEDNHFAISWEYDCHTMTFELLVTNERVGICVSSLTFA
jgi:hypothetical protein